MLHTFVPNCNSNFKNVTHASPNEGSTFTARLNQDRALTTFLSAQNNLTHANKYKKIKYIQDTDVTLSV